MKSINNNLGGALQAVVSRAEVLPRNPDDYERNGLLYCGKCGGAKQYRIRLLGNSTIVRCMCQCEDAAYQEERRKDAERDLMVRAKQLRVDGIQAVDVRDYTFSHAERTKTLDKCWRYVERWPEMLEHGQGLLFWGDVGTGKTFAAACIANALIDRGVPCLVTSFPKILNTDGWDKSQIVREMQQFSLVVLDDFGVERQSNYGLEIMQFVLDERYKSGKPLIVTTNLSPREFESPGSLSFARMFDRIIEMCVPIRFEGVSRRKKKAAEKLKFAREAFGDE